VCEDSPTTSCEEENDASEWADLEGGRRSACGEDLLSFLALRSSRRSTIRLWQRLGPASERVACAAAAPRKLALPVLALKTTKSSSFAIRLSHTLGTEKKKIACTKRASLHST
jgi:hypothetical protein